MKFYAMAAVAGTALLLSACQSANTREDATRTKSVPIGGTVVLNTVYNTKPDCTSPGPVDVRMVEQPQHGRVSIVNTRDFPTFRANNIRSRCNTRKVSAVKMSYSAEHGYSGFDRVGFRIIFADGEEWMRRYNLNVK